MTSGIYLLTFKNPKRYYIGKSKNIEKRYKEHCKALKEGVHYTKLQHAFNSMGRVPYIDVLQICHEDFSAALENAYINLYMHFKGSNAVLNTNYSIIPLDLAKKYCHKLHTQVDLSLPLIEAVSLILPTHSPLAAENLYSKTFKYKRQKAPIATTEGIHDI